MAIPQSEVNPQIWQQAHFPFLLRKNSHESIDRSDCKFMIYTRVVWIKQKIHPLPVGCVFIVCYVTRFRLHAKIYRAGSSAVRIRQVCLSVRDIVVEGGIFYFYRISGV